MKSGQIKTMQAPKWKTSGTKQNSPRLENIFKASKIALLKNGTFRKFMFSIYRGGNGWRFQKLVAAVI